MSKTATIPSSSGLKDPPVQDSFVPRRSNRVAGETAVADGDTWSERIAVCEGPAKLIIRSYYKNSRTATRVWDEPPSGASNVKHATAEMRKQAEDRLFEMQGTLDMIPDDNHGVIEGGKKGKRFFGRFRKEKATKRDDSKDLNLQRAIVRSMADQSSPQGAGAGDEPVVYFDPDNAKTQLEEDDALAMAKALSISESSSTRAYPMSEEEELQRALEASRLDAPVAVAGVASLPQQDTTDFSYAEPVAPHHDPYADSNQKMAAKPTQFDPYNQSPQLSESKMPADQRKPAPDSTFR